MSQVRFQKGVSSRNGCCSKFKMFVKHSRVQMKYQAMQAYYKLKTIIISTEHFHSLKTNKSFTDVHLEMAGFLSLNNYCATFLIRSYIIATPT